METNQNQTVKLIDGEALLDTFKIKNSTNFPLYVKSIWKDLSRRSEDSDKGFDKVIFCNYYDLPGLISTRLFNLFDKDKDGYLSYSEFSKGMTALFNSSVEELMEFIFNLFDENRDGMITSEDIRSLFQYIPLQKKNFSDQSFKDRLESQEELFDLITSFFKNKEKIDFPQFKKQTMKENSTIFLYIAVFLLTNKPFSDKTLNFYQKENGSDIQRTSTTEKIEKKQQILMASPNLTSKFSPSLKILNSPLMKKEKEEFKKELQRSMSKNASSNSINNIKGTKSSDFNQGGLEEKFDDLGMEQKDLLQPSRVTWVVNDEGKMSEIDMNPSELLDALDSNIINKEEEVVTYEGYLIKLVDDKLKKLWFTLYEKYLYCK